MWNCSNDPDGVYQDMQEHYKRLSLKVCPVCGSKIHKDYYEAHLEECFDA
jgi:hypothetical protein